MFNDPLVNSSEKIKSLLYFLLRKWILSSNKFSQVVQCAMSKTSSPYVVAKHSKLFTIKAYTFYFRKYIGNKFLWTCTPSAYMDFLFDLKKCFKYKLYYFLSNNKAFWRPLLSVGICFFTYCHHNRLNIFYVFRLLNKFTKCISM